MAVDVVVACDVFKDWMSDVMKARDCGRGVLLSSCVSIWMLFLRDYEFNLFC